MNDSEIDKQIENVKKCSEKLPSALRTEIANVMERIKTAPEKAFLDAAQLCAAVREMQQVEVSKPAWLDALRAATQALAKAAAAANSPA